MVSGNYILKDGIRRSTMLDNNTIISRIAEALLVDYTSVYYVDAVTNEYQWYSTDPQYHSLHIEPSGDDFFTALVADTKRLIYEEDQHIFIEKMQKENLRAMLKSGDMRSIDYRLMIDGKPVYHSLRFIRGISGGDDYFIFGVMNVDKEVRHRLEVEKAERERNIYNQIVASLAEHYDTLYYIDMDTNQYFEFSSTDVYKSLEIPTVGDDFFSESRKNLKTFAHPDDLAKTLNMIDKDNMLKNLEENNSCRTEYRLVVGGEIMHVRCSQIRVSDNKHVILALENINAEVKAKEALMESRKEVVTYSQIAESLASNYDVIYYVDNATGKYSEFTSNPIYGNLEIQEAGDDFFRDLKINGEQILHPEDKDRVFSILEKDYLISALDNRKQYSTDYRLYIDGNTQYTRLTVSWSSDKVHFIIGVENITDEVKREKEQVQALKLANELARRDELTGTKNKNAFQELETAIQKNIDSGMDYLPFAIVVCDINGLKYINDTFGHMAGDNYIRSSSRLICTIFAHSPVFRIGGDEFVAFLRSSDYENRDELFTELRQKVLDNLATNDGPVVASGISVYEPENDITFSQVFERADSMMYENKNSLKGKRV